MQRRLAKLSARLRDGLKRRIYEPAGQDGINCLLLAALDQLNELQLAHHLDVKSLRSHIEIWLIDNRTLIADADWRNRTTIQREDLGQLCSFGEDYWSFLKDERAVGTHVTVLAICGVLSEVTGYQINAQACLPQTNSRIVLLYRARVSSSRIMLVSTVAQPCACLIVLLDYRSSLLPVRGTTILLPCLAILWSTPRSRMDRSLLSIWDTTLRSIGSRFR